MNLLIAGLVLFFTVHLVPSVPALREGLQVRFGAAGYRTAFSLFSLFGIVLMAMGYGLRGEQSPLFHPVGWAYAGAPHIIPLAFILFAAANMRGYIRYWLRHPMLIATFIWALFHLLANGEMAPTLLFGSFLVYTVVDFASLLVRGESPGFQPKLRYDLMATVGGLVVAGVVMYVHRWLFGVAAVPWGL